MWSDYEKELLINRGLNRFPCISLHNDTHRIKGLMESFA